MITTKTHISLTRENIIIVSIKNNTVAKKCEKITPDQHNKVPQFKQEKSFDITDNSLIFLSHSGQFIEFLRSV